MFQAPLQPAPPFQTLPDGTRVINLGRNAGSIEQQLGRRIRVQEVRRPRPAFEVGGIPPSLWRNGLASPPPRSLPSHLSLTKVSKKKAPTRRPRGGYSIYKIVKRGKGERGK